MGKHFGRLIFAAVLALASYLLGGCVLGGLDAGFTLTPPGAFIKVQGFDNRQPQTQPVRVIGIDIAPADTLPAVDPI